MSIVCLFSKYFFGVPYALSVYTEELLNLNVNNTKYVLVVFVLILIGITISAKYLPEVSERAIVSADLLAGGDINADLNLSAEKEDGFSS